MPTQRSTSLNPQIIPMSVFSRTQRWLGKPTRMPWTLWLTGTVGLALVAAGTAFGGAPETRNAAPITQEEAQAYFNQVSDEAMAMMKPVDADKILEWTRQNLTEEAVFQVNVSLLSGDLLKGSMSMAFTKEEILAMGGLFAQATGMTEAIENYSLSAKVGELVAHGNDAATVRVRWRESLTVDINKAAGKMHGERSGPAAGQPSVAPGSAGAGGGALAPASGPGSAVPSTSPANAAALQTTTPTADARDEAERTHQRSSDGKLTVQAMADCRHLLVRQDEGFAIGLSACTGQAQL